MPTGGSSPRLEWTQMSTFVYSSHLRTVRRRDPRARRPRLRPHLQSDRSHQLCSGRVPAHRRLHLLHGVRDPPAADRRRRCSSGVVAAVIIGVLVERFILRPMVGQSHISIIMVTIGLAGLLSALVQMFFGTQPRSMPPLFPRSPARDPGGAHSRQPALGAPGRRDRAHIADAVLPDDRSTESRCARSPTISRQR